MEISWGTDTERTQLINKMKADFGNLKTHHDIGLTAWEHAANLNQSGDYQSAYDVWKVAICHLALLFENNAYWEDWAQERATVYKVDVENENIEKLKRDIWEQFRNQLRDCDTALSADDQHHVPLVIQLDNERSGIRIIKQLEPITVASVTGSIIGGRLMFETYGYINTLNDRFQTALTQAMQEQDEDDVLTVILGGERQMIMTPHQQEQLALCFSDLGYINTALEQQRVELAKRLISQLSDTPQADIYRGLSADDITTHYQARRDAMLKDLMWQEAFNNLEKHIGSAEEIADQFSHLITEAQKTDSDEEIHEAVIEHLNQAAEVDDDDYRDFVADFTSIMLKRYPDYSYGENIARKILKRGLDVAREDNLQESLRLIERAYGMAPRVHAVYHNMGLILRALASQAFEKASSKADYLTSLRYLKRARSVYARVLEYDTEAEDANNQLTSIDREIQVVMGKVGNPVGEYLGADLAQEYDEHTDQLIEILIISDIETALATLDQKIDANQLPELHRLGRVIAYRANEDNQAALDEWLHIADTFPHRAYTAYLMAGRLSSNTLKDQEGALRHFALATKAAQSEAQKLKSQLYLIETLFTLKDFVRTQILVQAAIKTNTDEKKTRKLEKLLQLSDQMVEEGELGIKDKLEFLAIINDLQKGGKKIDGGGTLQAIAKMLDGKLKYTMKEEEDHIWVAFQSDVDEPLGVAITVDEHFVYLKSRPVGITEANHDRKLYDFLYMTFDIDFFSVQWEDEQFILCCQIWKSELDEVELLDVVIRTMAKMADTQGEITADTIRDLRTSYMTNLGLQLALARMANPDRNTEAFKQEVIQWSSYSGVSREPRKESVDLLLINGGGRTARVQAIYKTHGTSFVASYADFNMLPDNLSRDFLIGLAKMNSTTGIFRIAIDSDGDVGVLYETPYVTQDILQDMHSKFEAWLSENITRVNDMYNL